MSSGSGHAAGDRDRVRKTARSKTGCLTCLRRKCAWRAVAAPETPPAQTAAPFIQGIAAESSAQPTTTASAVASPSAHPVSNDLLGGFDFNNSIWHDTSMLDPGAFEWPFTDGALDLSSASRTGHTDAADFTTLARHHRVGAGLHGSLDAQQNINGFSPTSSTDVGGPALVEHFLALVVPPILSSVEVGPRWTSTKMLLASLAGSSPMVRHAMMAFTALEVNNAEDLTRSYHRTLYDKAARLYSAHIGDARNDPTRAAEQLSMGLATAFFLAYSDLVTNRVRDAQGVLKDAASLLSHHRNNPLEQWSAV
ncbi:hypothetical protein LTR53_010254 [Teratosphaeriaceae sp. CCFEE 6253]|nr:hypothetical protein LTR53_010254 [Teratosphaeriaceae sp. CCFEE 6253]